MIDLDTSALDKLPPQTQGFSYDRSAVTAGIVHLSVGNFHRAHQAWYIDQVLGLEGQSDWGICGVGLIDSPGERLKLDVFPAQDNLYTLSRYGTDGSERHQVIGSIIDYLFAPGNPDAVLKRLTDPATRIVSLTITEGGYNQRPGTTDYYLEAPLTVAELNDPAHPKSAFGYIVEALRRRWQAGDKPFTVLSCDNLRHNGQITRNAVLTHARALDQGLAEWIAAEVSFPSCMVDRITPGVRKEDADRVNDASGVRDRLPIISEDFAQWVVEDKFCNGRPSLEAVGAQMVADVHPYELAKVRMLNASHSMLAYPGYVAGLETVNQAMAEPRIRRLLEQFMDRDVIPTLQAPAGMDLADYRNTVLSRFSNPTVGDRLERIAGDGGSKLPTFLGPTVDAALHRKDDVRRLAFGIACFARYLRGIDDKGHQFVPFEPHLSAEDIALAQHDDLRAILHLPMFHDFNIGTGNAAFIEMIADYRQQTRERGVLAVLGDIVG